jgi:prevent-host-death family protein
LVSKTISLSEARRLLPRLVDDVARDGGRIDITRRGEPMVSIVRSADLEPSPAEHARSMPDALQVELVCDPAGLVDEIRDLRSRVGRPRVAPEPRRKPHSKGADSRASNKTRK